MSYLGWRAWDRRILSSGVPPLCWGGRAGSSFQGLMGRKLAGLHPAVESPPRIARSFGQNDQFQCRAFSVDIKLDRFIREVNTRVLIWFAVDFFTKHECKIVTFPVTPSRSGKCVEVANSIFLLLLLIRRSRGQQQQQWRCVTFPSGKISHSDQVRQPFHSSSTNASPSLSFSFSHVFQTSNWRSVLSLVSFLDVEKVVNWLNRAARSNANCEKKAWPSKRQKTTSVEKNLKRKLSRHFFALLLSSTGRVIYVDCIDGEGNFTP